MLLRYVLRNCMPDAFGENELYGDGDRACCVIQRDIESKHQPNTEMLLFRRGVPRYWMDRKKHKGLWEFKLAVSVYLALISKTLLDTTNHIGNQLQRWISKFAAYTETLAVCNAGV